MLPVHEQRNGDVGGTSGMSGGSDSASDESGGEEAGEGEYGVREAGAPARALDALNALRKSRQHYDVLLVAAGAEVPAHRALLAAHSPYLLRALAPHPAPAPAPPSPAPATADEPPACPVEALRVEGVEGEALRALVEYVYTGRLAARDAAAARALYRAAWRLRVEPARALLAERLARRLQPHDALPLRALPDLPPHHLHALDSYIAHNFDEVCASGALAALPLIRIEMVRASSADGGSEAPLAVADAALAWLRDHHAGATLEELCARTHLLFVNGAGELRDCGELPAACGDAPELQEYRRERLESAALRDRAPPPAPAPRALPGAQLGARAARADCSVLAARGAGAEGGSRVTRALLVVRGALAAARVAWREAGDSVAMGGPLGGAGALEAAAGERRAQLPAGRCALGAAVLRGRLVVCGGYDRARVLRAADAYDPAANAWAPLPAMRTARARFPAAQLAGRLYALGGSDGQNELDSVDMYEENEDGSGGAWRSRARLPLAVVHAGAAAAPAGGAGGALYAAGGWAGGRPLRAVHRYQPDTDTWHEAPPLNTARSQCACVWWEGRVWALGGCDAWHCLTSVEQLGERGWEAGPALPTARRSVGGCGWRGRLVAAGGSDGAASLRRVDWLPAGGGGGGGEWRAAPALRRARAALGLAVLHDVLYAVGGFDGKEFLSCVECLYAPDGEWTTLCAPPAPRALPAPATPATPAAKLPPVATTAEPAEPKENGDTRAEQ